MRLPNVLEWFVTALVLGFVGLAIHGKIQSDRYKAEADMWADSVQVLDANTAHWQHIAATEQARTDSLASEAARIAQDAQEQRRRAQGRVEAARDSVEILRARMDSVPPVVDTLIAQFENVIANQDTVIATLSRELEAERLLSAGLRRTNVALTAQVRSQTDAIAARDQQIVALENALDADGWLPWPDGIVGDVLKVGGGYLLGRLH